MGCCSRYVHHHGCWHDGPSVEVVDDRRWDDAPRRRRYEQEPPSRRLADLEDQMREVRRLLEDVLAQREGPRA